MFKRTVCSGRRRKSRINCCCTICGNWYTMKHALERALGGAEIKSDDFFEEFEDYINELREKPEFNTCVEQFVVDKSKKGWKKHRVLVHNIRRIKLLIVWRRRFSRFKITATYARLIKLIPKK